MAACRVGDPLAGHRRHRDRAGRARHARRRRRPDRPCSAPRCSATASRRPACRPPPCPPARPARRRAARRVSGCEISRTCRITSASATSSSVARKAATSSVGSSLMNPTVSDRMARRPEGRRNAAHGRVQRGEQLVPRHHLGAGHRVEQRRFAGVGVADQRDHRERHALARSAVQMARAAHLLQLLLQPHDAVADQPPVSLDLRLAGAAEEAEAAALALQMGPGAHQPAALVLQMREFDLQRALAGARALAENIEDQAGAVDDLAVPGRLQVALLHRATAARRSPRPRPSAARSAVALRGHLPLAEQRRRAGAKWQDRGMHHRRARSRRPARPPPPAAPRPRGWHRRGGPAVPREG